MLIKNKKRINQVLKLYKEGHSRKSRKRLEKKDIMNHLQQLECTQPEKGNC